MSIPNSIFLVKFPATKLGPQKLPHTLRKQLKSVTDIISGIDESKKLSSLFVWGPSTFDLAGNNSTGDSIIEKAGGKNAADSVRESILSQSVDELMAWNPDTMLMWYLPNYSAKLLL